MKETKGVQEVPSPWCGKGGFYLIRGGGIWFASIWTPANSFMKTGSMPRWLLRLARRGGGAFNFASDQGTVSVIKAGDNFEAARAEKYLKTPYIASPLHGGEHALPSALATRFGLSGDESN